MGCGVDKIIYKLNNGSAVEKLAEKQPFQVNVQITQEGKHPLEYWSVDKAENEEAPHNTIDVMLDKTLPTFFEWQQEPRDLTVGTTGSVQVTVTIEDKGGSGLDEASPALDYRIGQDSYDGFAPMQKQGGNVWTFTIPEPSNGWKVFGEQALFYKVQASDIAKNIAESKEQQVPIGVPATASLQISPAQIAVEELNKDFTVDVRAENVKNLSIVRIVIKFEPEKLKFVSAKAPDKNDKDALFYRSSDKVSFLVNPRAPDDEIDISTSILGGKGSVDGSGVLAKITFQAISEGETRLTIDKSSVFRDSKNQNIPLKEENRKGAVINIKKKEG